MIDLNKLPYPIASLYHEMETETNPLLQFRLLIKTFAGFLKYVSLLAISDYLNGNCHDEDIDKLFTSNSFSRPSLGHWNHFLREILAFYHRNGLELRVKGLINFYYKPGKGKLRQTNNAAYIDSLINVRNTYIHPDIWPPENQSRTLYEKYLTVLNKLIESADFLRGFSLMLATDTALLNCSGYMLGNFSSEPLRDGLIQNNFYLLTGEKRLSLLTFLFHGCPDNATDNTAASDILLYEGRTSKKIRYLRGNYLSYLDQSQFKQTEMILEALKKRLGQDEMEKSKNFKKNNVNKPAWKRLQQFCETTSKEIINFHVREGKYHRNFYLPRKHIESTFHCYLNGIDENKNTTKMLNFVGDSGCGKTNLLCHLTEKSLSDGHCVLHLYGRNYSGEQFTSVVASELVAEEDDLIPFLIRLKECDDVKGGKKLIILIDAINEYSSPVELYKEVIKMTEEFSQAGIDYCKVVISTRTATWRLIDSHVDTFRPELMFFEKKPGEKCQRPYVEIGVFSPEETEQAYELYLPSENGERFHDELRGDFKIIIQTPFSQLPPSIRIIVSNPIFMKMLIRSVADVRKDLTASDILLMYYKENVPQKHRYFLHYFLQALWDGKRDYIDEDCIEIFSKRKSSPDDYRLKLAEYYYEGSVSTSTCYICSNTGCRLHGRQTSMKDVLDGQCPECGSPSGFPMLKVDRPVYSTFFFMVDEGIMSVYQASQQMEKKTLISFTYDRFFEIMMARYLFYLYSSKETREERLACLKEWLHETRDIALFDSVFTHLLVFIFNQKVVPDADGPRRLLFKLERKKPDTDAFCSLVSKLLETSDSRVTHIIKSALCQIGITTDEKPLISSMLLHFCNMCNRKKLTINARLSFARVALATARSLKETEPFVQLGSHKDSNIRMLAAIQSYFLWKQDETKGLEVLEKAYKQLFFPLGIPKPPMMDFLTGTAILIFLGHPQAIRTVDTILALCLNMTGKMRWFLGFATFLLAKLAETIFKDIPTDYNPVNLTELRLAKKQFISDAELRSTALSHIEFLKESGSINREKQYELIDLMLRKWPKNNALFLIYQLVQAKSLYDQVDNTHQPVQTKSRYNAIDNTIKSSVAIAKKALELGSEHWFDGNCYCFYWFNIGDQKMNDDSFELVKTMWQELYNGKHYQYHCLSDNPYYSWIMAGLGMVFVDRLGAHRIEFLEEKVDFLFNNEDKEGIFSFLRGLDVLGAELGFSDPRAVRLTLSLFRYILNTQNNIPEKYLEKIAHTLFRMEVIFPDDIELFMESQRSLPAMNLMKKMMHTMVPSENIGILAGQRSQEFFLYAMGKPYWRNFIADIFTNFIESKSLSSSIRFLASKVFHELNKIARH